MCGICGAYSPRQRISAQILATMAGAIKHRGPDDSGEWTHAEIPLGLGFRRLAILDLSPLGHQPMFSRTSRFTMVFNGEVYNFLQLRQELESGGASFKGGSDTEVILAAFEQWGVVSSLPKLSGMFAMAVWDEQERTLSLVRDRLGKKPLYYGWNNGAFVFGSELKALSSFPGFERRLNVGATRSFFERGYVPSPQSILSGVWKLPPGCVLQLNEVQLADPGSFSEYPDTGPLSPKSYWSVAEVSRRQRFPGGEDRALSTLQELFERAVKVRMISDVPLGAFLSGGVDSSLVVSAMQKQSGIPVKTFTIGFREDAYNEAHYARKIAEHLGTDHTEVYLSASDSLKLIPRLAEMFDEPLADASQLPTYLVSEVARQKVIVALNGDGGDELFIGYNRYVYPEIIINKLRAIPAGARKAMTGALRAMPPGMLESGASLFAKALPASKRPGRPGDAAKKLLRFMDCETPDELYDQLTRYWPGSVVTAREPSKPSFLTADMISSDRTFLEKVLLLDLGNYLCEDLLAKVDRASMATSIESRSPLLDYELVEFASSLPTAIRAKGGERKYLLRRLLSKYLPAELYERPKMGFSVPVGDWLRRELRSWGEDKLSLLEKQCGEIIDCRLIRERWQAHQSGSADHANELWCALVFADWFERWRPSIS